MNSGPKLGEILVHADAITSAQFEAARRNQVIYGGRLGTNLIELGYCDEDTVAQGLSRQHHVAAALRKHLDHCDPALLAAIPRNYARECLAFPIARLLGSKQELVVCFRDPTPAAVKAITSLGIEVLPAVASELAVVRCLVRFYNLPAPKRYIQIIGTTPIPSLSHDMPAVMPPEDDGAIDIDFDSEDTGPFPIGESVTMPAVQLVDLDHASVVRDTSIYTDTDPNISVLSFAKDAEQLKLGDSAASAAAAAEVAITAARRAHRSTPEPEPVQKAAPPIALTAGQAVLAIDNAMDRQGVSDALIQFLRTDYTSGLMTMVRENVAFGLHGFGGLLDDGAAEAVIIPLEVDSIFRLAWTSLKLQCMATPKKSSPVQERFFRLFPARPAWLVCAPVIIRSRLVSIVYAHAGKAPSQAALDELVQVTASVEAAFMRLIQSAREKS